MTPLKFSLNHQALQRLAHSLKDSWPIFAAADFIDQALIGLEDLELKERVEHIYHVLTATFLRTDVKL